ncbi:hypothetical protein BDV98DRAFT_508489, partial [Pterulicium gracile]
EYEKTYPADAPNEGMAPNARVWRVFLDEAAADLDMVEHTRDTVDVILVFAGLFSAIVSTLTSQASAALQPDIAHVTSALLTELIQVQRAIATGSGLSDVVRSTLSLASPSTTSSTDRWVNAMWFISLAFSLSTTLLAVLVKQWIQAYVSPTSGTPHTQARIRRFRYMGIEKWHVALIVGLLSSLLHLSLFLFFIGLVVLLFTLDITIAIFVTIIALLVYTAYALSNLLPVWYPHCPYRTPMSTYTFVIVRMLSPGLRNQWQQLRKPATPTAYYASVIWTASSSLRNKIRGATRQITTVLTALISTAEKISRYLLRSLRAHVKSKVDLSGLEESGEGAGSCVEGGLEKSSGTGHAGLTLTLQR